MSLLMQALRKAERAKRNHPQVEGDVVKPSEEFDDVLELAPPDPPPRHDRRATDQPSITPPDVAPGLTLAPLDEPVRYAQPSDFAPQAEVMPHLAAGGPARTGDDAGAHPGQLSIEPDASRPGAAAEQAHAEQGLRDEWTRADAAAAAEPTGHEPLVGHGLAPAPPAPAAAAPSSGPAAMAAAGGAAPAAAAGTRSHGIHPEARPDEHPGPGQEPAHDPRHDPRVEPRIDSHAEARDGVRPGMRAHANTFEPGPATVLASHLDPPRADRSGPPPKARGSAAAAAAAAPRTPRGFDARTIRVAALLGVLVIIACTFGYIYWRAVYGPGSSKNLPPVPMPGLAATTQPADGVGAGAVAGGGTVSGLVIPSGAAAGPVVQTMPAASPAPRNDSAAGSNAPLPSNIGAPPTYAAAPMAPAPATPLPVQVDNPAALSGGTPSAPLAAAAPVPSVPRPSAAQLQGLSPEDYDRMDRQAAAARDAEAARALANGGSAPGTPGAINITTSSSAGPAAATPAAPAGATTAPVTLPPSSAGSASVQVSHSTTAAQVNPLLQGAYAAFRQGDLDTARAQYAAMLQQDPANRDALLGSAAVALRARDTERAADIYGRLLESNPMDADAMAGLASLRGVDPAQAEARLRRILARNPDAPTALYALGNLYARQGRWSEAQQQYFRAFAAAPQDADYAFNLAVSLDRINKPRLALDYYQRALALSEGRSAGFDRSAVTRRIQELGGR